MIDNGIKASDGGSVPFMYLCLTSSLSCSVISRSGFFMRWGDDERFVLLGELVPESFSNLLPAFELEAATDEACGTKGETAIVCLYALKPNGQGEND